MKAKFYPGMLVIWATHKSAYIPDVYDLPGMWHSRDNPCRVIGSLSETTTAIVISSAVHTFEHEDRVELLVLLNAPMVKVGWVLERCVMVVE